MSPDKTGPDGCYRIEKRFRGVGEIRQSLHTKSLKAFRQRVAILEKLEKREAFDVLRAFQKKQVTIEELVEADARGELAFSLSGMQLRANLWDAIEKALPNMAGEYATKYRYRTSLKALQRKGARWLGAKAQVADLAHVPWRSLKAVWGGSGTDWMHLRRAVSRFLTIHLGKVHHPFRLDVMDPDNFPTAREKKRQPELSLREFQSVIDHVPDHLRSAFWTIVLTGMRLDEYVKCAPRHLNLEAKSLHVPGRKTEDSDAIVHVDERLWGTVTAAIPCRVNRRWLQKVWLRAVRASGLGRQLTIHDLRHIHGHWAVDAGVLESKVQSSYRHTSPAMTRRYLARKDAGAVSAAIADAIYGTQDEARRRA